MIQFNVPLFLASNSPRRKKLLKQLNLKFKTFSVDIDEHFIEGENPESTVKRLANEKMLAAESAIDGCIIITADTVVVCENKIIGKPQNKQEAFEMLRLLSGNIHKVYTGFAIKNTVNDKKIVDFEVTEVVFQKLNDEEINDYIDSGSPMDKAGAYGIQDDFGAVFVKKINGCYYNVVGLPLAKLYESLKEFA